MLDYKIVGRKNPLNPQAPLKYYAVPSSKGLLSTEKVCKEITVNTTTSVGEMYDAFRAMSERIPELLLNGNSVRLGDLGTMRISFGSSGADSPEEFKANMIRDVKIVFQPDARLVDKIRRESRFNRAYSGDKGSAEDSNE